MYTDEEIKKKIVDQFYWDSRIDPSRIKVEVQNGAVTLTGKVPTYLEAKTADEDTRDISGVVSVFNDLKVEYPADISSYIFKDPQIESNIKNILQWNENIDIKHIQVSVTKGWVTLEGSVDALWKKYRAEDLAEITGGVVGITNKISIVPSKKVLDETVAREIVEALDRNVNVDVESVDVTVKNGEVTLSGTVPNWAAHHTAYETALFTAGTNRINDQIAVIHGHSE